MADLTYVGKAPATAQVTTIAVTGTWATGDTASLTINGKTLTVTIGTNSAIADVVAAIVAMVNASSATASLVNDESRNFGGNEFSEWQEVTASGSASPVTLTADTAGVPFTVTVAENTAGDGALGTPSEATGATGPNDVNNALNYSTENLPVNSDVLYIDKDSPSLLYNLDQLSAVTLSEMHIRGFQNTIGLPRTNASGSYPEYREMNFQIGATLVTIDALNSTRIKLDFGSVQTAVTVVDNGVGAEQGIRGLQILGTNASNEVNVYSGDVAIAPFDGEASTVANLRVSGGSVESGRDVTMTAATVLEGSYVAYEKVTTLTQRGGDVTLLGDTPPDTYTIKGGVCIDRTAGTTATKVLDGGTLDISQDLRDRTFTDATFNGGVLITGARNPTYTNPPTFGADLAQMVFESLT